MDFVVYKLLGALIVLGIGWLIAVVVGRFVSEILRRLKFDQFFEKAGFKEALEKAELKVDAAGFIGEIVKWVLFIIALVAAVDILGFKQFTVFLIDVANYLPNVIVAVAIFVVTVIIVDYLTKIVRAWVEGMKTGYGKTVGEIVRWAIWVFAIVAILLQLGVAKELVITLFTGAVAFCVIAGGIAFGLGGKEIAGEILRDLQKKLKK